MSLSSHGSGVVDSRCVSGAQCALCSVFRHAYLCTLQAITPAKTPVPCGITLEKCTRWDGHDEDGTEDKTPVRRIRKLNEQPVSSYAEFAYPANTTHLFIISRGGFSVGSFHVEAEDEDSKIAEQAKGDLKIEVEMIYKDEKFLDQAKVCKVQRRSKDGSVERGLGIFVRYINLTETTVRPPIDSPCKTDTSICRLPPSTPPR